MTRAHAPTRDELLDALQGVCRALREQARGFPFWAPVPRLSVAWAEAERVLRQAVLARGAPLRSADVDDA